MAPSTVSPKVQKKYSGNSIYHKMIDEVEDYAILLIDKEGTVQNWNKGAEKIKGYKAEEIIGKNFRLFYLPADRRNKLPEKLLKQAIDTGHALQEGWRLRSDGTRFWGSIAITCIRDKHKEVIGFTKVTRDLTEKRKLNEHIRDAIWEAQEKEREEISGVLHDNVAQILSASAMFVKLAEKQCTGDYIGYVKKYVLEAIDEVRRISHRLNPTAELSRSLSEAIQLLVDDMNLLSQAKFTFIEKGKQWTVRPDIEKLLFRIFQAQVGNIIKHSSASEALIKLEWARSKITLIISDNGVGFDISKVKKGLGLESISYRAQQYDGDVSIVSSEGAGCDIIVTIPLKNV